MQQYRIDFPHEIAEKEKDRQLKREKKNGSKDTPKKDKAAKNGNPPESKEAGSGVEPQKMIVE